MLIYQSEFIKYDLHFILFADNRLVADDAENVKGDYAFDNPAFKGK